MNRQELHALIAQGESATVEFKSDRGPLPDHGLIEAVVCLANYQGGVLLVGVEDDGEITGLHANHQTSPGSLAAFISGRTVSPLSVEADFVKLPEGLVAVIQIPAARQPVSSSDGRLTIRTVDVHGRPGCRPLYPHELINWRAERGTLDPSSLPIEGTTWNDLDPLEFERLRRMLADNRGDEALLELPDREIARALGLFRLDGGREVATLAGLLLVGKESSLRENIPAHEVAFQVMTGTEVKMNEFRRWPLLRALEWIMEAFQVRNEERELNIGLFRVGIPAYDRRGFREAVNNAFIHRNYADLGAVHVQMHDDHIRITNPGGFVEGVRPENLLVTEPRPRNPRLADAFKRIGLVERVGRGVAIIYRGQLRNGRLPPDYSQSTTSAVSVTLPGGPADLDFVQLILTEENRRQQSFGVDEMLLLAHLWREREVDTHTATQLTQKTEPQTRAVLEGLVESGLVERRGRGKGRLYILSAGVYRAMGQPAAYVHARGFEPEQMEQMILNYLRAHGRITRRETVELCRISPYQATRLLQKLVKQDKLSQHGKWKGTYYTIRT
jgi:ATP-dependent DNA helicase RecG